MGVPSLMKSSQYAVAQPAPDAQKPNFYML